MQHLLFFFIAHAERALFLEVKTKVCQPREGSVKTNTRQDKFERLFKIILDMRTRKALRALSQPWLVSCSVPQKLSCR